MGVGYQAQLDDDDDDDVKGKFSTGAKLRVDDMRVGYQAQLDDEDDDDDDDDDEEEEEEEEEEGKILYYDLEQNKISQKLTKG